MGSRSVMHNSVRSGGGSFHQNSIHEKLYSTPSTEEKIKFAGDESKDRLYEPKQNKKMVRVVTVIVYVFSVSLAAIMLSLYYGFFWKAPPYSPTNAPPRRPVSDNVTSNKTACSCVDSHDGHSHTTIESATFPFQLDNTFNALNTVEDEVDLNTLETLSFNDTDQTSMPSITAMPEVNPLENRKNNSLLLKKIAKNVQRSKTSNDT